MRRDCAQDIFVHTLEKFYHPRFGSSELQPLKFGHCILDKFRFKLTFSVLLILLS